MQVLGLPAACSPELGTPQQEMMPHGSSVQVRMTPGCLCSASSTTWVTTGQVRLGDSQRAGLETQQQDP